jgi:hypothetical protein
MHPFPRYRLLSLLIGFIVFLITDGGLSFTPFEYNDGMKFSIYSSDIHLDGITVLSWKLSYQIPEWTKRMLSGNWSNRYLIDKSACNVEILAVFPKIIPSRGVGTLSLPNDSSLIDTEKGLTGNIACEYVSVAVGWERKKDTSNPPRPAFIYCPFTVLREYENNSDWYAPLASTCSALVNKSTTFQFSLVQAHEYEHNTTSHNTSKSYSTTFVTNSPHSRGLAQMSPVDGIGVCTNSMHRSSVSSAYLKAFVDHYSSLGFDRVILHDAFGHHNDYIKKLNIKRDFYANFTYLNYTIWSMMGLHIPYSEQKGNNIMIRKRDQASGACSQQHIHMRIYI